MERTGEKQDQWSEDSGIDNKSKLYKLQNNFKAKEIKGNLYTSYRSGKDVQVGMEEKAGSR